MSIIFFFIMFNLSFMLTNLSPWMMMILIMVQMFFSVLLVMFMTNVSLLSYILFLVYLGGVMVLFFYMVSLANNEYHFSLNLFNFYYLLPLGGSMMYMNWMDLTMLSGLGNMYMTTNIYMLIYLMLYLYILMLVVVKMCLLKLGSLRSLIF